MENTINGQFFAHYEDWEDYKSGMYETRDLSGKDEKVIKSILLLKSKEDFSRECNNVVEKWPIATKVNFTNKQQNRRAWLGAAACMISHGCTEVLTRIAWNLIDKKYQDQANLIADSVIDSFLNSKKNAQTLFEY